MLRRCLLIAVLCLLPVLTQAATNQRGLAIRPVAPTGEEAKGNLWLLNIGINSYLYWPQLKTAINDARAVKDVLLKRYHLNRAHVIELTEEKATRHNILAAFRDLAKRVKPEDSLLVYYAGHGHIDPITGKGSWIPVESGTDDPTAWIDNRNITDYLNVNAIKARHILMVSDSCFSGDFFRGSRGALPTVDDAFLKKAYTRSSRQAISSGGLEPVSDAGFGGNSVFSHFLVASLESNSKPYLIPSEIFGEIKAGVGRNADQLPQFGDLHGVGGQDGGELILFLKGNADSRMQDIGATSVARQKELEQLKNAEAAAVAAKQKELVEIGKREQELAKLDKQIADMKERLGNGAALSGDSLDNIIALADQMEAQGNRLEELRKQREEEEQKRQQEIERLKKEAASRRVSRIKADLGKYEKVAASKYAQNMKNSAWGALLATYPEAKGVAVGDTVAFLAALELVREGGELVNLIYTDFSTRLMWARNGNIANKKMEWIDAMSWVKNLTYGGYRDWRLPTKEELEEFAKRGSNQPSKHFNANGFNNVQSSWYWTSSTSFHNTSYVWSVDMGGGFVDDGIKTSNSHVWPVRSEQIESESTSLTTQTQTATAPTDDLAFLEGDWELSISGMKLDVHLNVRGNQVEYSSSPGGYKAVFTAKLNEGILVFSGRSTSHPKFGEIIEKYRISDTRSMQQFFVRSMGSDNEVNGDLKKK